MTIHDSEELVFGSTSVNVEYSIYVDRGSYHLPPSTDIEYNNITIIDDEGKQIDGYFLLDIAEDYFISLEEKLLDKHEIN